jgi:hypothetical protein
MDDGGFSRPEKGGRLSGVADAALPLTTLRRASPPSYFIDRRGGESGMPSL